MSSLLLFHSYNDYDAKKWDSYPTTNTSTAKAMFGDNLNLTISQKLQQFMLFHAT